MNLLCMYVCIRVCVYLFIHVCADACGSQRSASCVLHHYPPQFFWICNWPWRSLSGSVLQVNVLLSLCLQHWGYRHWLTFLYEWWRSELSSLDLPSKHFTNSPAPGFLSLLLEGDNLVFTVIQVSSEGTAKNICFPFLRLWVLSLMY